MIGLYLPHFFRFGIADEVHEAKAADTAQGNALGTLAAAVDKTIVLTGTLTGGMASAFGVSQKRTACWRPSLRSSPRRTRAPKRR